MQNLLFVLDCLVLVVALIFALSFMDRKNSSNLVRALSVGVVSGLCAFMALMDPLVISEGVLIDGRNLFVGFAAATSGPIAAVIALIIAGLARLYLGGIGTAVGLASMVFCVLAGLLWRELDKRDYFRDRWRWPSFAALLCLSIPLLLMLPGPLGVQAVSQGGPGQAAIYIIGSLLFGLVLSHENHFIERHHELEIDADIDPLTSALNRRGLEKQFAQHQSMLGERTCFIAVIDVDNFKMINDRYGHDVGDIALCEVVTSLKRCTRSNDLVARIGGDEFALIAFDLNQAQATAFHTRLNETLQKRLQIFVPDQNLTLPFSATLGVAYHESTLPRLDALLEGADKEMMRRKRDFRAKSQDGVARPEASPRAKVQDGRGEGSPVETRSAADHANQNGYRVRLDVG